MKNLIIVGMLVGLNLLVSFNSNAALLMIDTVPGGAVESSVLLAPGDSFNLDILINDVFDLAGFQFELMFDSSILTATSITSGDLFGLDTFLIDDSISAGLVSFAEVSLALFGQDINANTKVASISFDVIGAGVTPLNFMNVVLSDSFGDEISAVQLSNAQLTSQVVQVPDPNPVPAPASALLLILGLGGIFCSTKKSTC
jgi:hypothetical protein